MKNNARAMVAAVLAAAFLAAGQLAAGPRDTKAADTKPAAKPADAKAELVDINSATEAELIALPAIGKTYAKKIIAKQK